MSQRLKLQFSSLFFALLLTIAVAPIIHDFPYLKISFDLFLSITLLLGCFIVSRRKILPWIETILVFPMLLATWSEYVNFSSPLLSRLGLLSGIIFFAVMIWVILQHIFSCRKVTLEVISAALVAYLLIGVMWGLAYAAIESMYAGSFNAAENILADGNSGFIYYSFISLTTVGYGDITPITGFARSLSLLEGIIGQSYMAVLVARLVGMQVATSAAEKIESP